jgi:hypothetical protein
MSNNANYLDLGSWNSICDRCGRKVKFLKPEWTGLMTCNHCWDPRHPVTLPIPMARDSLPVPRPRPRPNPVFITTMNTDLSKWGGPYELHGTLVPDLVWSTWDHTWGGDYYATFNYTNFPEG